MSPSTASPWQDAAEADAEARRLAQSEFASPVVLEAGAGTGKTAVLVARIVVWSLGPGWERIAGEFAERSPGEAPSEEKVAAEVLRRIVAITFTEAAAAEMATRVGQALLDLRAGGLPVGLAEDQLPPPMIVSTRAEALVGALDQLGVRTIHAFCRRLLAGFALDAGLRPDFEVDADGQLQAQVVREVLEAELPRVFGDPYDEDYALLAANELGPGDVEEALLTLLSEGAIAEDLERDPLAGDGVANLFATAAEACARFRDTEGGRLQALGSKASRMSSTAEELATIAGLLEGVAAAPDDEERREACRDEIEAFREGGGRKALQAFARGEFGASGGAALGDDTEELQGHAIRVFAILDVLVRFDPAFLSASRRVLWRLLDEARRRLRARGVETFGGLLRGARDLLQARPDLVRDLRRGIDQILVDEFQDTDALQCELLASLALDGDGAKPGLFLVGDPKQSIYGWRGADLRAYQEFVDTVRDAGGVVRPLVANFRSVPEVLTEVERIVEPLMVPTPGLQPPFEALLPRAPKPKAPLPDGRFPVEHWVSWGLEGEHEPDPAIRKRDANELEARAVAADLQRLREEGVDLGDVALLFRSTGDFDTYLGALRDAGLPFVVEREESHAKRREVMDAMALVRCLLDPNDALALVATLRSSFIGVPDAAWLPLWRIGLPARMAVLGAGPVGADLPDAAAALAQDIRAVAEDLRDRATHSEIAPGLQRVDGWEENLVGFVDRLGPLRRLGEEGPVDRFVEALRADVGLEVSEAGRHLGAHRLASLDRVFRDLAGALETTASSSSAVLSFLRRAGGADREHREGRPRSFEQGAVHLLTIHKSKGLDFGHVYLLQTHKGKGNSGGRVTRLHARGAQTEFELFGCPAPGVLFAEQERNDVEDRERVRLLYVATTRAKQRMVIVGCPPSDGKKAPPGTQVELLKERVGAPDDLRGWMEAAARDGTGRHLDEDGVLWRFPALEPGPVFRATTELPGELPSVNEVARQRGELAARQHAAAARMSRSAGGTASEGHDAPQAEASSGGADDRRAAMELGTAVHEALEALSFDEPPDAWRARLEASLERHLLPGADPATRARARELLDRFVGSELPARLHGLAGHVLGREVPLFLDPASRANAEEDGPVGFVAGAIDLLYRSPEDGQIVVADYKTDRVPDPSDEAALRQRAASYAPQGQVYVAAVQAALGLPEPPRFELWFLDAGQVLAAPLSEGQQG